MSDRLKSLFSLAAHVTAAKNEPDVLSVIVNEGVEVAGASAAVVGLVEGESIRLAAAVGYPPGYLDRWATFPLEAGTPMSDVIASSEPSYCGSREERDRRWPRFRGTGNAGSEAFVVLPLAGRDGLLGALTLSYREQKAFDDEERMFLDAFSAQCALALERSRATAAEAVARTRTERLQRFTARLAPALTVESVTEIAIDKAIVASGGATAVLGLASEDGRTMEVAVVDGNLASDEMRAVKVLERSDESAFGEVFRLGTPLWLRSRAEWERYPAALGRPDELQAVAVLPVATADRFFGVLAITFDHERSFPDEERRFLLAIAGQTAQALDRARLYEEQRHIAHVLQQSLLPKALPSIPGVELATRYQAAGRSTETGGDFYDVFEINHDHFVVIGDVCGKGPAAAALTALCRHTLHASAVQRPDIRPAEMLGLLNRIMFEQNAPDKEADIDFASVTCVRLQTAGGDVRATIASGGHPPTLVRRRAGAIDTFGPTGPLVGLGEGLDFSEDVVELEPGDMLILHTDGLTDARGTNGDRIGDELVRQTVGSLTESPGAESAIAAFDLMLDGLEITDDIAIVALQISESASRTADEPAVPPRGEHAARHLLAALKERL